MVARTRPKVTFIRTLPVLFMYSVMKDRGTESLFSLLINKDIPDCSFGLIVFWLVVFLCCRVMKYNVSLIRKSKVNISA